MTSTQRSALLRFATVGWLFAVLTACTGEVAVEQQGAEKQDIKAPTAEAIDESVRRAAEQGDAGAQGRLAKAHYLGLGAAQDFDEALRWARLAADQGDAIGQGVLAAAYNTGSGVEQDYEEALRWARPAVDQGDAWGQDVLASLYNDGLGGLEQDFQEAMRLYRLGAEQGYAGSQTLLGMMYMAGEGVEQDFVTAHMWLSLGASGPGVSGGALDVLVGFMTPEQIAEAEARARDWEPTTPAAGR